MGGGNTPTSPYTHPLANHQHLHRLRVARPPNMANDAPTDQTRDKQVQSTCIEQPKKKQEKEKTGQVLDNESDSPLVQPAKEKPTPKRRASACPPVDSFQKPALGKQQQQVQVQYQDPQLEQPLVSQIKKDQKDGVPRLRCRHCLEWYNQEQMWVESCEYAPDGALACINAFTCILCAECMLYHCMSDSEGEFDKNPCSCACESNVDGAVPGVEGGGVRECRRRWCGLFLLSLLVPCLCCYMPLRACHGTTVACGLCGGRHEPI